ncbi:hypothetical protein IHE44_0015113 [Lamprotornis superbus]|uniref:Uncharacterized protein n=1 Tax=Lamprotornis superbus TaxID=245042 RepID=A0A835TW47_9PASS|nr:hypothetical protein IHE44_0015113 [Lamprotornis superbus]
MARSSKTFWTTTGMFPQELIIGFPKRVKISKVAIQCYLVRTLRIERSTSKDPVGFQQCVEKDLQHREGQLQMEEFPLPEFEATYLRFIIKSAFDHFVSVHRFFQDGTYFLGVVSAGALHMMHSGASCLSLFPQQHLLIYAVSKPSPATWLNY